MLCSQPANFRDWHHITTEAKAIAKLQAFERGDDVVDGHVGIKHFGFVTSSGGSEIIRGVPIHRAIRPAAAGRAIPPETPLSGALRVLRERGVKLRSYTAADVLSSA